MSDYLLKHRQGFPFGYTAITTIGEIPHDTGIQFGILKLKAGEAWPIASPLESSYLLIQGKCILRLQEEEQTVERKSCFDEDPFALHVAPHHQAEIQALTDCEFSVAATANHKTFPSKIYSQSNMLESELRGKGLLNDTACRMVRTLFDIRNSPDANLVLGEVVTAPGKWSSYPPHHHAQPEIYHYRFTEPQGYGFAECGEQVFKVKQFDTYKILNQHDHAQTAAPGYGMYYIWVIRHLENQPYEVPEFTEEHRWTKLDEANDRVWKSQF